MRKFINVFGNTNYDKDILDSADNFGDFIDANLIPENGFDSPIYVMWELTSVCPKSVYIVIMILIIKIGMNLIENRFLLLQMN